jgi:hypothetical protein
MAQTPSSASKYVEMTGNGEVLTDAGTVYVTIAPTLFYEVCSFQAIVKKDGGTPDGIAKVQSSIDGINYIDVDAADTLSIANVTTNTKVFVITHNKSAYYRIAFIGRNTQESEVYGFFWGSGTRSKKSTNTLLSSYSLTSDTVTNTGTSYLQITLNNYYEKVSFQPVVTKVSGTAAGTVTLQGSVDGTNYVTVSSDYSNARTMTVTNVTTSTAFFVVTSSPYRYYRLSYTGSGTMVCTLKGYVSLSN